MEYLVALFLIFGAWSLGLSPCATTEPTPDESTRLEADVDSVDPSRDVSICTAAGKRTIERDLTAESRAQ